MDFNKEYSEKFDERVKEQRRVCATRATLVIISGKDLFRQFQP